jgi:UDP-MurNAc hydroxylase
VSEESPMNHDAALVVHGAGRAIVNLNDGRLSPQQMRAIRTQVGGPVDALLLQGAGASWYPMCYGYGPEREAQVAKQKRISKLAYAAKAIKIVEPLMAFAFAGPPCFLDPELSHFNAQMNEGGIFPDPFAVTEWLKSKGKPDVSVFLPGDTWDLDTQTRSPHADSLAFDPSPEARPAYLAAYAQRRAGDIASALSRHPLPSGPPGSLWPAFRAYFEKLLEMSEYFDQRIGMRVAFEVTGPGGGAWAVDFRRETRGVYDAPGEWQYRYRFESRFLGALVGGELPWEDFFLSLRFAAARDPDLYNDHLLGLLKFADPGALAAVERYETTVDEGERITIYADGEAYRIPRRCPHAGNDLLETGEVLPERRLRCLAHHYDFRLDTGACETASCPPLQVERLEHAKRPETVDAAASGKVRAG